MSRSTQDLLLDAAERLCRARHWLDARVSDREHGLQEAARHVRTVRGLLEGIELDISREAASREIPVEGSR